MAGPIRKHTREETKSRLHKTQKALHELEATLDELSGIAPGGVESLPPLERAQVQLAYMHAALALTRAQRGLAGETSWPDELKAEQRICEAYAGKVQRALARRELATVRRPVEVNIDAAHRFIEHAMNAGEETRDQLKRVAQRRAAGRDGQARHSVLAKPEIDRKVATASKGLTAAQRVRAQLERRGAPASRTTVDRMLEELDMPGV